MCFQNYKKTLNRKRRGFECNILKEKVNGRIFLFKNNESVVSVLS